MVFWVFFGGDGGPPPILRKHLRQYLQSIFRRPMRSSEKNFVSNQRECSASARNVRPVPENSLHGDYPQCKMSSGKAVTLGLVLLQRKRNSVRRRTGWAMGKALSITSSEFSQQHSVKNSSYRRPFKFSEPLK